MFRHLLGALGKFAQPRRALPGKKATRLRIEVLENRLVLSTAYLANDLVADQPGIAPLTDPNLVNAWGISRSPTAGAFWVSANGRNLSTLYAGDVNGSALIKVPLEVAVQGGPTGQVFNGTPDFRVSAGAASAAPLFIFASESGVVTGWSPVVPPGSRVAQVGFQATDGAIYKGMDLANNGVGNFLYVADFHNGKIDVLNGTFQLTTLAGSFTDPTLPAGYAPFNVAALGGKLYVSYALQDAAGQENVAGPGRGFVNVFDLNGNFQQRLISRGRLNSPWGMAIAPANFGDFSGALLVGNYGDGRINAYNATTGAFLGTLTQSPGRPIVIDGLLGLVFGNGVSAGDTTALYYAAGPDNEAHGLFGKITANPAGTNPVKAALTSGNLLITGSRNNDIVDVRLDSSNQIVVTAEGRSIGTFASTAVNRIQFNGFAGNDIVNVSSQLTVNTILNGGAGNDLLIAGGGNDILLGSTGIDTLLGGNGLDILIGGAGSDLLLGGADDDLLIGGTTAHDNNVTALTQILTEWTSGAAYDVRVANLRAGTGGIPKLDATTVFDDAAIDLLLGGAGQDWFFAGTNDIALRQPAEQLN